MPNDILWEVYAGPTPAWKDVSGRQMVFGGSAKNIDTPLVVGEWQRGVHLGTADPGVDVCGKHHVPAPRFVDAASFDSGTGQEHLNDTNLAAIECTIRIHVRRSWSTNGIKNARLFIYDSMDPSRRAEGLKVYAFQQGVGASQWTLINDGDAGIGGDNPGERLSLGDSAPATDHYFYVALSIQLQRYDIIPTFNIGYEHELVYVDIPVAASSDDATERMDTTAVSLTDTALRLNYDTTYSAYSLVGVRFQNTGIPQNTTISSAKLQFAGNAADSTDPADVTIYGEDIASPVAYQANNADISARARTTASVAWPIQAFAVGKWRDTPDLAAIITEIISRGDWAVNNNMAFMLESAETDANRRAGRSYNNPGSQPPRLYVDWTPSTDSRRSHLRGLINFCTGDPEYEIWILDAQQQRRHVLEEIPLGFHWEKSMQGWGSFSDLRINLANPAYEYLRAFETILIRRGRHDLLAALVEKPTSEMPQEGESSATYTVLGRSLNALLERRVCVPLAEQDYLEYNGHPDDACKYMVQYNLCDTYADRDDDTGRVMAGFTVQPARSECPQDEVEANRVYRYNHEQTVGQACKELADRYGLDYEVKADGDGRLDFETYYPWRGVNRSEFNPEGNRQIVFTVSRENLVGVNAFKDRLKIYNVVYVLGANQGENRLIVICKDESSIATYGRREGILSMGSTVERNLLEQKGQAMLAVNGRPVEGVTFTFRQTEALKYGRDFDVGDYVSVYFEPFQVNLDENWRVKRVSGSLVESGEVPGLIVEELEITLGKDEPDILNDQPQGGSNVGPIISQVTPTTIYPDDAPGTPGLGDPGDPDDPNFPQVASILHIHGILTDAPYDTGGRTTNIEDQYAADNPGEADTQFVCRSHQHALYDTTTPEAIAATGSSRVNASDNHAAYRSHRHGCARYSHTHTNPTTDTEAAHTHTQGATGAEAAHTHTQGATGSDGAHTHPFYYNYVNAAHCHNVIGHVKLKGYVTIGGTDYNITFVSDGTGHEAVLVGGTNEQLYYCFIRLYNFVTGGGTTGTITSAGAHTHTNPTTGAGSSHTHTNPTTGAGSAHSHTQGPTGGPS